MTNEAIGIQVEGGTGILSPAKHFLVRLPETQTEHGDGQTYQLPSDLIFKKRQKPICGDKNQNSSCLRKENKRTLWGRWKVLGGANIGAY